MNEIELKTKMDNTKVPYKIYAKNLDNDVLEQFFNCIKAPGVVKAALMPDAHKGYVTPIGSVIAVKDKVYPSIVGYDIGCGVSESTLAIKVTDISKEQLIEIRDEILKVVPIGIARHEKNQPLSKKLTSMQMTDMAKTLFHNQGGLQIGTLGGGNHFLELGKTNSGYLSIIVHSGSRGIGHKIASHYMQLAATENMDKQCYIDEFNSKTKNIAWLNYLQSNNLDTVNYYKALDNFVNKKSKFTLADIENPYPLNVDSKLGKDYISDMNAGLQFALDNRQMMIDKTKKVIAHVLNKPINQLRFINRNHNHASIKNGLWIHRKGATHAEKGMLGVIPGNMVHGSFIVKGKGNTDALCSSSHGAGRALSRTSAKNTLDLNEFREVTSHLVANHSDKNIDEAPKAYKNISKVMELQLDLVDIVDKVVPILNIKG